MRQENIMVWVRRGTAVALIGLCCLGVTTLVWAAPEKGEKKDGKPKTAKSAAAKKTNSAKGKKKEEPPAQLPKNVDVIRPMRKSGAENLPLSPKALVLGNKLSVDGLEGVYVEELTKAGVKNASDSISDDRFIRRIYLDLIGVLPPASEIVTYVQDSSPEKKAKLVDKLLADPRFGVNWARYWNDVIVYRATNSRRNDIRAYDFVPWLAKQINENKSWDKIVTELITANGDEKSAPQGILFGAHSGKPAEMAAETSRIFLGVQIGCAECHDHPSDSWKREQFHQFASFYGRTTFKQAKKDMGPVIESKNKNIYRMPDLKHPEKTGDAVSLVFLTGQAIPENTTDDQRRKALAAFLTSKQNTFFAKSFVNRVWAELIGYGFTNPVDDLGVKRPVLYPDLFRALSSGFASSNYDIKELFRVILNSRIYDRRFDEVESYGQEGMFRSITPTRLYPDQIQEALAHVLARDGKIENSPTATKKEGKAAKQAAGRGLGPQFREAFGYDPSLDKGEIEGSIQQALILMNSPMINQGIRSQRSGTIMSELLLADKKSRESAIELLYLTVLARKPTSDERAICSAHLKEASSAPSGFEDLIWILVNSTEFLHNQ